MIREYPAYGRTVAAHLARGVKPICVGVLLSTAWWYFDQAPKVCIRPDEWRRGRYEFGFLRGMHVVAVAGLDCTEGMLAELLMDLMKAGPRLLWVWSPDGSKMYDEGDPAQLAHWVFQLSKGAIDYQAARSVSRFMSDAQAQATDRWLIEYERIKQRSEDDAGLFALREYETLDRVRALFSSPWPSDAAA